MARPKKNSVLSDESTTTKAVTEQPFELTESLEDYLETIANLIAHDTHGHAHIRKIALAQNVKMPSVTRALNVLRKHGFVYYRTGYPVTLTQTGNAVAQRIIHRHRILKSFLKVILQLHEEESSQVACHIEHVISDTCLKRIEVLTETLLHGNSEALGKALAETLSPTEADEISQQVKTSLGQLEQLREDVKKQEIFMTSAEMMTRAHEVINTEIKGLEKANEALNETFIAIVHACLETLNNGGKIVVTGIGKNIHIGEKISATMASTGTTSMLLNPVQAMHGDLGMVTSKDIVLAISYSGESDEVIRLIPSLRRLGVKVIGMTGNPESSLAKNSDWVYEIRCGREACPFNMAPTTSTTATLALGDALAMVLLEARGFKKENFALLHPAGAIGRALLFKVSDIMRQGDRLVKLPETAVVKDAVVAMTSVKSGCACIVNDQGVLVGVFTDGDLRRLFSEGKEPDPMACPITKVMTVRPVSVKLSALAVEVLHVFENYKIDDLPVVDQQGMLVGTVDIQDLPRMKIL